MRLVHSVGRDPERPRGVQMTPQFLLSLLLSFAPHKTDKAEPANERASRMSVVADVIAEVSKGDPHKMALLLAQGQAETHFARYTATPEGCKAGPKGARCDIDKRTGEPRAKTHWQTWRTGCPKVWEATPGSREELVAATECTLRLMGAGARRCKRNGYSELEGAFAGVRGGAACTGPSIQRRVKSYRRILGKLTGKGSAS
jgi:hypothetical protein